MPSSVRAFLALSLLLVAWQCYIFVQAFSLALPPPGLVASTLGIVLQEFLLLWLIWMVIRRRTLGRWLFLLWFVVRLALPLWLEFSFASFSAFWKSLMATGFWHDPATVDMLLWAGALYFVFSGASKPWFRKPDAPADLRVTAGIKPEEPEENTGL